MKIVLQRVDSAYVCVDGEEIGRIGKGLVIFLGVAKGDNKEMAQRLADKISRLRIFADKDGKTNLNASAVNGGALIISQFTLMADCAQNRPSFSHAADAQTAREIYEYFIEQCEQRFASVATGRFAAHMHIYCENDGPFTIVLEA